MSFEDVLGAVGRWTAATDAFAALGAELSLRQTGDAPPEIVAGLHAISTAAGLGDLGELAPPQQAMLIALVRTSLRQAADLLEDPGREPGWKFTDPDILDGWGRGSTMVPTLLAAAPELSGLESFLDVGTGVGLLAVAAAGVWPTATIVGIDTWEPSLARARANVAAAGLDDRITLRTQDVAELDDVDRYDCAWVPTFFMSEPLLAQALPKVLQSVHRGGWVVLGLMAAPPDPLAEATMRFRTIRNGGCDLDSERAGKLLEQAGCTAVHTLPRASGVPMEFIFGQRPA